MMYSKEELKELRKRLLKVKSKNKYDIIKLLFDHEKIVGLDASSLCALLAKKMNIKQDAICYDAVRKWRIRYLKENPNREAREMSGSEVKDKNATAIAPRAGKALKITDPEKLNKNDNLIELL